MAGVFEGGCLCGRVRYKIEGTPRDQVRCHCRMCQQSAGAPSLAWVTFARADLQFTQDKPRYYRSSAEATRGFCGHCGTQLVFQLQAAPDEVDVTCASMDDPEHPDLVPKAHLWTESKIKWVALEKWPAHPRRRSS